MKANPSPMSVADYCQAINANKIVVNKEYQRKDGLWNNSARSFFIESILLEYPIPKLFLYAKLDLQTRETVKEIVDGQQRSQALIAFFSNQLPLAKTIDTKELRGLTYDQLEDEFKTKFLSYPLPIDQFSGVPEDEVREAFRRMNANNVPLNAEEQRNAQFQGPFKWFIVSVAEVYKEVLFKLKLLSQRDLIRMADLRLYAEIALTIDSGFQTVKGEQLNRLYKKYNSSFEEADEFRAKIDYGINFFLSRPGELHDDAFLRPHVFQSIVLAAIDLKYGGALNKEAPKAGKGLDALLQKLERSPFTIDTLASSLREPESYPQLHDFVKASTTGTNTKEARATRFLYFRAALSQLA